MIFKENGFQPLVIMKRFLVIFVEWNLVKNWSLKSLKNSTKKTKKVSFKLLFSIVAVIAQHTVLSNPIHIYRTIRGDKDSAHTIKWSKESKVWLQNIFQKLKVKTDLHPKKVTGRGYGSVGNAGRDVFVNKKLHFDQLYCINKAIRLKNLIVKN